MSVHVSASSLASHEAIPALARDKTSVHPDIIRLRRAQLASNPDVRAARQRIRDISSKWDVLKQGPLRGFDCVSLDPTAFREQLKRNFGLLLNARELGGLVAWYDKAGENKADCNEFTKDFWQIGRATKAKHAAELNKITRKVAAQQHKLLQDKVRG
jgi:hypothetical protein